MTERETGQNRTVQILRSKTAHHRRRTVTPREMPENHRRRILKKTGQPQLSQSTVDAVSRFADLFQHDHPAGGIRQKTGTGQRSGNREIADQRPTGRRSGTPAVKSVETAGPGLQRCRQLRRAPGIRIGEPAEHRSGQGLPDAKSIHGPVKGGDIAVSEHGEAALAQFVPVDPVEQLGTAETSADAENHIHAGIKPGLLEIADPVRNRSGQVTAGTVTGGESANPDCHAAAAQRRQTGLKPVPVKRTGGSDQGNPADPVWKRGVQSKCPMRSFLV